MIMMILMKKTTTTSIIIKVIELTNTKTALVKITKEVAVTIIITIIVIVISTKNINIWKERLPPAGFINLN